MPAPTTGILDDFNRADEGPPPSANWSTDIASSNPGLEVYSNACGPESTGSFCNGWWDPVTFGPDSEVYITIVTLPLPGNGTGRVFLWLRLVNVGSGTTDGYACRYTNQATDATLIFRYDNGLPTQLGASISQNFADGDKLFLSAQGSTIEVNRYDGANWTSLGTRTDATYNTAGNIGLGVNHSALAGILDDFGGGTMVAGQPTELRGTLIPGMRQWQPGRIGV